MQRKHILPLCLFALPACTVDVVNTAHCSLNEGDTYCADLFPDRPLCNSPLRTDECDITELGFEIARYGCVSAEELKCHEPCGDDPTCESGDESSSSSGGETEVTTLEPSSTTEDETESGMTTTTGPECMGNAECMDPARPFCVAEICEPCSAVVDGTPDEACMGLDEATPLCIEDACVQCSAENAGACGGGTPICDEGNNTCVECRFHEECQELDLPACNIATGACFSGDAASVSEVNAGTPGALQAAVTGVAPGGEHTIVVTGSGGTNHTITIDGGRTIAIVSASDSPTIQQEVRGNSGSPTLTVTGAGTTVYLHRLALTANTDDVGVSVGAAGTLYADSTRVAQNTGGGITLATGSSGFLRNCMVQGNATSSPAISATGANLDVLYTSLGLGFNPGDPVLQCSGGTTSMRNSIVLSWTPTAGTEIACAGLSLETSSVEASSTDPSSLFDNFGQGDYSLTAAGQTEFEGVATWQDGDPLFDFEGDARPNENGASDFAGADFVP